MNYSISLGKHSADKDHTTMTGGTLTVDKAVRSEEWVQFYTYEVSLYHDQVFDEGFHKWVHTAEHMIAYKKDTGSVRSALEEISWGAIDGKVILDISPFKTGETSFGFRITSMIRLETEMVQKLIWLSITRAIEYLESWEQEHDKDFEWIPFARSISCGQYDYHHKKRAIKDLKAISTKDIHVGEKLLDGTQNTAYVCDLRFLKPKLRWRDDMIMFSPDFSYRISLLIEKELPNKLSGSIVLVWTFGCMTGMYLCVSSAYWDESDIGDIHGAVMNIIDENIQSHDLSENEAIQLQTLRENYKNK